MILAVGLAGRATSSSWKLIATGLGENDIVNNNINVDGLLSRTAQRRALAWRVRKTVHHDKSTLAPVSHVGPMSFSTFFPLIEANLQLLYRPY